MSKEMKVYTVHEVRCERIFDPFKKVMATRTPYGLLHVPPSSDTILSMRLSCLVVSSAHTYIPSLMR